MRRPVLEAAGASLREPLNPTPLRRARDLFLLTCVAGALLGADGSIASAQDSASVVAAAPDRDHAWLGLGLGVGSEDFAGSANLSYQHGVHLLSLRYSGTTGLFEDGFQDVALLYGRATSAQDSPYRVGVGLGIGLVDGCTGGGVLSSCEEQGTVVGLPIEAHLTWLPSKVIGIALYGFADFNRVRSFGGITVGLQVGDLR